MAIPLTLNGIVLTSARVVLPWRGPWFAEVEFSPDVMLAAQLLASNPVPAVLTIGDAVLTGTVDPLGSGTFSSKAVIRVIGGRGGWGKRIPPQHFGIPGGGVTSTMVYLATGAAVGEIVTDTAPELLGEHWVRQAGPASEVFGNKDWFVEPTTGITFVASWPPLPLDPTATLANFEPAEQRATIIADGLIRPGSLIVDLDGRLNGQTLQARDVEQTFNAEGSSATVWCSPNKTSRLIDAFTAVVRNAAGVRYLKVYRYVLAVEVLGELSLQAVSPDAPDLVPIKQWTGLSGALNTLAPGTEVLVGFADGDPRYPFLLSFSPDAIPLTVDVKAATTISLTAPAIGFVGAATFGVPGTAQSLAFGPWAAALMTALGTFASGLNGGTLAAQASALATALGALPPAQTLLMKGN